jgi:flavin reductase (DIM6/NTAB) family NADH-FMN oxidoreductase RutF
MEKPPRFRLAYDWRVRVPVELKRSYRLINHGPTTLITSAAGGRRNVMAAAWVVALDFDPPKLAAVIAQDTFTRQLVDESGEFVVNLPTRALADLTWTVGSVSGRELDKFARYGIATEPATRVSAPLVAGCAAWLECRVLAEPPIADKYDLFVAEVVAAWADNTLFDGASWRFPSEASRTIHHLAGGTFFTTGERFDASKLPPGEEP